MRHGWDAQRPSIPTFFSEAYSTAVAETFQFAAEVLTASTNIQDNVCMVMTDKKCPGPVKINFDNILANPTPVVGDALAAYFVNNNYGISVLSQSSPNSVGIVDARCEYGGCAVNAAVIASSPPNIFTQFDGTASGTNSYTLGFSSPLTSFSFTRVELVAGGNGITHPQWTAQAFNAGGQLIAGVGEGLIASFTNVPPASYTLGPVAGQTISAVTISGNAFNFAAFGSPILDDFVLTYGP